MNRSIWQDTSAKGGISRHAPLSGNIAADVLVIGGGMAGLLTAVTLSAAGAEVVLAERGTLCGGVTQNTTAKITSQHGLIYDKLTRKYGAKRALEYLRANENALRRYRELCKKIDCDFEERPSYVYSLDNRKALKAEVAALNRIGFPARFTTDIPLPFPTAGAIKFPRQAQFNPLKFAAAISKGFRIYENTEVLELLTPHTARTAKGKITAKAIVCATHFPFISKHGSYFLKMYQQRSYVLALTGDNVPDLGGMYIDEAENGMSFRNYGNFLFLGGGGHRTGKTGGGWRGLSGFAYRYFPDLKEEYRWATQDCMTLDGIPYIGRYSANTPDFYVATGFNKWGMTSSMAAAALLTDMITGRKNEFEQLFSPSRSILKPQLALNALEAASNLLTPTERRCPHMGCALKWNSQEHSWDCPCHGSRFDANGTLLDNPATGNIKAE